MIIYNPYLRPSTPSISIPTFPLPIACLFFNFFFNNPLSSVSAAHMCIHMGHWNTIKGHILKKE